MLFQSRYEQAELLCLDISICRIMNFSWDTTDTHTQSCWVIPLALFGYIYSWKRQTVQTCAPLCRAEEWFSFTFTAQRGCFISFTRQHSLFRHYPHLCDLFVLSFVAFTLSCHPVSGLLFHIWSSCLMFARSGPPYTGDFSQLLRYESTCTS